MTKDTFSIIDQYLAGELSETERLDFEHQLKTSPELRKDYLAFKTSVEALLEFPEHLKAVTLSNKLKADLETSYSAQFESYESGSFSKEEKLAFEKQLMENEWLAYQYKKFKQTKKEIPAPQSQPVKVFRIRPLLRYAVAASIAIMISLLAGWYFLGNSIDTNKMYALYNVPELYPNVDLALVNEDLTHRGVIGSNEFSHLKKDGLKAYEAKDWDKAINLLSDYMRKAKPSDEETPDEINLVNMYIGRAWLEKGETSKAINAFLETETNIVDPVNYGLLKELIQWQLVLGYLKNDDIASARTVLEKLTNAAHPVVRENAVNLLNEIK